MKNAGSRISCRRRTRQCGHLPASTLQIESATSVSCRAWMRPLKEHHITPYGAPRTQRQCQAVIVARENISFRTHIPRSGLLRSKAQLPG
jgi:hypothetical protein